MKLVIGSDHAGFHRQQDLREVLRQSGHDLSDIGSHDPQPTAIR